MNRTPTIVLSIAGSDSGGGAGIQADIKTLQAFGCFAATVITAITAQNSHSVIGIEDVSIGMIKKQLQAVFSDIRVQVVKIGMLSNAEVIAVVAEALQQYKPAFVVLDPVMVAKSGDHLLQTQAVLTLKEVLLPLADVITPNLPEAETILGRPIKNLQEMEQAAIELAAYTKPQSGAVVLKGGHLQTDNSDDLLYCQKEKKIYRLSGKRLRTLNTHGSGCTFSSAIAGGLANGLSLQEAVRQAKAYIHSAIETSFSVSYGGGDKAKVLEQNQKQETQKTSHGPLNHWTLSSAAWPKKDLNQENLLL